MPAYVSYSLNAVSTPWPNLGLIAETAAVASYGSPTLLAETKITEVPLKRPPVRGPCRQRPEGLHENVAVEPAIAPAITLTCRVSAALGPYLVERQNRPGLASVISTTGQTPEYDRLREIEINVQVPWIHSECHPRLPKSDMYQPSYQAYAASRQTVLPPNVAGRPEDRLPQHPVLGGRYVAL